MVGAADFGEELEQPAMMHAAATEQWIAKRVAFGVRVADAACFDTIVRSLNDRDVDGDRHADRDHHPAPLEAALLGGKRAG